MKNKSKYIIGLIIIAVAFGLVGAGLLLSADTNKPGKDKGKNKEESFYDMPESERLSIQNCKTKNCQMPEVDYYDMLVINKNYKILDEKVEKINNDTKAYYNMVKESTTNNEKCAAVKDLYNQEYRVQSIYYNYENDKYASVAVQRNIINLCDNNYERKQVEWYLYDKKEDKILTQEEFREKELINDQEIAIAVKKIIMQVNEEEGLALDPATASNDMVVFYDFQGDIIMSLFVPELNIYYTGTVRINVENN